jgi:hypothetical protein
MNEERYAKYGAATGIVFVALVVIGFLLILPKPPDLDSPAQDWTNYFTNHQSAVRSADVVLSIGLFFFIFFIGTVSTTLRALFGNPRLPTIAFGGGLLAAASLMVTVGTSLVAAQHANQVTPELTRTLNDIGVLLGVPGAAGIAAFFGAIAIVVLRTDSLPDWLGWLSGLTAVAQFLAMGVPFTDTGAFAGDGVLGFFVPFTLAMVTIVAISIVLIRTKQVGAGITDRVRGAVTGAAAGVQGKAP